MFRKAVILLLVCVILSNACNGGRGRRRPIQVNVQPGTGSATVVGGGGGGAAVPPGGVLAPSSTATPTGRK
ncbi:hypothetical protein Y032_0355g3321 [Ancylostoma ceylanicum]|uniref:Uncharacterized protein n=1 Tax=Ancylostoma ceylanicum TaxID=53326 RepID=A0A016RWA1_9BILA|nr:hypothetical protein Y032_0355g3321 [Ancylostoma ceylanicum]